LLKIRLSRTGKKSQPSFQILVQEHTLQLKGKFIEKLGYYNPTVKDKPSEIDLDRVKYWIGKGAQPTDAVAVLLKAKGMDGMDKYIAPRDKKKKKKNDTDEAKAESASPVAPAESTSPEEPPAEAEEIPKEESPVEEAPAEAPAEEPKAEEAPAAEDAPKEEAPAEAEEPKTTE